MERNMHWMVSFIFGLNCLFMAVQSNAQSFTLLKDIRIDKPVAVSVDRSYNVYVATQSGVHKYSPEGNLLQSFSPATNARVSSIDAWESLQVLVFYRDTQTYTLLNRFLSPQAGFPVQFVSGQTGFVRAATLSTDNQLWLFDETDFSLKKYGVSQSQVVSTIPLELVVHPVELNIAGMRAYQNMLYVNDYNYGLLVFDNMGNYVKKLPFPKLNFFSFLGDELYFVRENTLHFFDLYTLTQREIPLPVSSDVRYVLWTGERLYLFTSQSLKTYQPD